MHARARTAATRWLVCCGNRYSVALPDTRMSMTPRYSRGWRKAPPVVIYPGYRVPGWVASQGRNAIKATQALPGRGHAERALQASWWQEHGAAHDGGPRAQQAGKLETWALFAGSQGGRVAPAGGNTCAPRPARLDLRPPRRQEVQPLRPSGRDYDPDWLSPRLAGVRVVRSAMVAD